MDFICNENLENYGIGKFMIVENRSIRNEDVQILLEQFAISNWPELWVLLIDGMFSIGIINLNGNVEISIRWSNKIKLSRSG